STSCRRRPTRPRRARRGASVAARPAESGSRAGNDARRNSRTEHRGGNGGGTRDLRRYERVLAVRWRGTVKVSGLDQGLPGTARAERRGGARGAGMKVPDADRADPQHLLRPMPDLLERRVAHVPARDGQGDTWHHVDGGSDVTGV